MKILDRYLLKHFIGPFLFCLLMFILLYVVIDLFDKLNEMIENNVDLGILFPYYLNFIPLIFVQMTPIAVLISTMYSLGTFNRHNEILAMQASGMSLLRILRPLIITGFLISVATFIVNDRVVPSTIVNASEMKEKKIDAAKRKKKQRKGEKILENIAFFGEGNKIIYARRYSVYSNKIVEFIMHSEDENQNIVSKTTATEVQWDGGKWLGKNVMFYHLDSTGRIIGEPKYHEEKYLDIKEAPVDFRKRRHQTQFMSFEFMSFAELKGYIERFSFESGPTIRNLKVALHQKVAFPFISLIVILIAAPFALVHTRKGGLLVGVGVSIALVFGYYALMTISLAMGKAGFLHPIISAWLTNILFACIGLFLIIRHK